jgi:hypothetical protein
MKKIFTFVCCIFATVLFAQTSSLDPQLVNINKSSVTSGIIYERVPSFANLYSYNQNGNPHNTADYRFFEQALSELHRASNKNKINFTY